MHTHMFMILKKKQSANEQGKSYEKNLLGRGEEERKEHGH